MGQRTFRSQLADSLSKDYNILSNSCNRNKECDSTSNKSATKGSSNKDKLVDVKLDFFLEKPLHNCTETVRNGIINSLTNNNLKINKLVLFIRTTLNEYQCYSHLNLQVLFGLYFIKDINSIEIHIISNMKPKAESPEKEGFSSENSSVTSNSSQFSLKKEDYIYTINNRKIMDKIIEYMVFKTKVNVVINNKFIYHILPGFKNHSIVLTYNNQLENYNSDKDYSIVEHHFIESLIKDFIHHSYSEIVVDFESFQNMKLSINKQIPNSIKNIIVPTLVIKDLDHYDKDAFITFFKFLTSKFNLASIKIKFMKNSDLSHKPYSTSKLSLFKNTNERVKVLPNAYGSYFDLIPNLPNSNYEETFNVDNNIIEEESANDDVLNKKLNLIRTLLNDLKPIIKEFVYLMLTFEFNLEKEAKKSKNYLEFYENTNTTIKKTFKQIIIEHDFQKLALMNNFKISIPNSKTNATDEINKYSYVYYNSKLSNTLITNILLLKSNTSLYPYFKRKPILMNYLSFLFGKDFKKKFLVEGEYDFSIETIPNRKILLN